MLKVLAGLVGGLLLTSAWAFSSPLGSSADEDFHLASIWCASGESAECQAVTIEGETRYSVSSPIGQEMCYQRGYTEASLQSAACLEDEPMGGAFATTHRVNNIAAYYPPMYYRLMNTFVGPDPIQSLLAIRFVNSLVGVSIAGLLLMLVQKWIRRPLAIGLLVAWVPFGAFFVPSVNPTSWAILGVFSFWAFLLSWLVTERAFSVLGMLRLTGAALSGLLIISSRSDAALYAIVTVSASIIIAWPKVRPYARRLWLFAIPIPFLLWALAFRFSSLSGLVAFLPSTQTEKSGGSMAVAVIGDLVRNGFEIPAYLAGALGANAPLFDQSSAFLYGIGSVDIRMPSILPLITVAMVAGVLFLALRTLSIRRAAGIGVLLAALTLVPLLATSRFAYQYSYAPRYIYPLLLASIAIAVMVIPWRQLTLSRVQVTLLAIGFSVTNAVALLTTVRRYTNGQKETWLSFFFTPEWWWNFGPSPQVVVLIGSLAGIGVAAGLARIVYNPKLGSPVG